MYRTLYLFGYSQMIMLHVPGVRLICGTADGGTTEPAEPKVLPPRDV